MRNKDYLNFYQKKGHWCVAKTIWIKQKRTWMRNKDSEAWPAYPGKQGIFKPLDDRGQPESSRQTTEEIRAKATAVEQEKPKYRSGGTVRNMLRSQHQFLFQRLPFLPTRKEALPHAQQHKEARTESCECNSKLVCTIFNSQQLSKQGKKISMVKVLQRSIFAVKDGCIPEKHFEIQGSARQEADLQTLLP